MKLISDDHTFIYYAYERADGKTEGIRIGRSVGATGFVSDAPISELKHPAPLTVLDRSTVPLPLDHPAVPIIIQNAVGQIEDEHPEIRDLLFGRITFEDALAS